jgi:hypothetical protein
MAIVRPDKRDGEIHQLVWQFKKPLFIFRQRFLKETANSLPFFANSFMALRLCLFPKTKF